MAFAKLSRLNGTPIAIIGGGLAGLTCAYRLAQYGIACEVFEASPRIGGRVLTYFNFSANNTFCELGAEYIDNNHAEILALARELGLETQNTDLFNFDLETSIYHVKGQYYLNKDLETACAPLAERVVEDLDSMYGESEFEMITYKNASSFKAEKFDRMTLVEYLDSIEDLEDWVKVLVKMGYESEYGIPAEMQSALNLLMLAEADADGSFKLFGSSDESVRIKGGNGLLTEKLHEKLLEMGVSVHLGHKWVRVSEKGNTLELDFETQGSTVSRKVEQMVCSIPFSTLRRVEGVFDLDLKRVKKQAISKSHFGTHSKFIQGTTSKFWLQAHGSLPASNGTFYSDVANQMFWDTSQGQDGNAGVMTDFMTCDRGANYNSSMDSQLQKELLQIFQGQESHLNSSKVGMNWSKNQFSLGSYSALYPGEYSKLNGCQGETELKGKMLFAGEHCSINHSGYMNGAVETGQTAADQIIRSKI